MFLRFHRPLVLLLILSLFLGLGGGSLPGRGALNFALAQGGALWPGPADGLHDICVSPSSAAPRSLDIGAATDEVQESSGPEAPRPISHHHEHCPDCLVRLAGAPPPDLPDFLSADRAPSPRTRLRLSAPMLSSPWMAAHGARAPPTLPI
jgi:hypothetical protein